MKVEKLRYKGREEIFGIDIEAEDTEDEEVIQRFWNGGAHILGIEIGDKALTLTFADLIKK